VINTADIAAGRLIVQAQLLTATVLRTPALTSAWDSAAALMPLNSVTFNVTPVNDAPVAIVYCPAVTKTRLR
jgi:hypothetical protein